MLVNMNIDKKLLEGCFDENSNWRSKDNTIESLVNAHFLYNEEDMAAIKFDGIADKNDIKHWLLESDNDELEYFKNLIEVEIADREAEDLANVTNYTFSLNVDGQVVDATNLDENNPEHAMEIFLDECGWSNKISSHLRDTAFVELVEEQRGQ